MVLGPDCARSISHIQSIDRSISICIPCFICRTAAINGVKVIEQGMSKTRLQNVKYCQTSAKIGHGCMRRRYQSSFKPYAKSGCKSTWNESHTDEKRPAKDPGSTTSLRAGMVNAGWEIVHEARKEVRVHSRCRQPMIQVETEIQARGFVTNR